MCPLTPTIYAQDDASEFIDQEVRFHAKDASEIFLIWGVNGWKHTPESSWNEDTFLSGALLHTSLHEDGNVFVGTIRVPRDSKIGYLFYIYRRSDGSLAEIYQHESKDTPYIATASVTDPIEVYQRDSSQRNEDTRSPQTWAEPALFLGLLLLTVLSFTALHKRKTPMLFNDYAAILTGIIGAYCIHLLARIHIAGRDLGQFNLSDLRLIQDDWRYLALSSVLFSVCCFSFRSYPRIRKGLYAIFNIWLLATVVIAVFNVSIVPEIGGAFNYQWLYYSGFLGTPEAQSAIMANIGSEVVLRLITWTASAFLINLTLYRFICWIHSYSRLCARGLILAIGISFAAMGSIRIPGETPMGQVENPVLAFIKSVYNAKTVASIYTMDIPEDLRFRSKTTTSQHPELPKIDNILVYVMESAGARYLDQYGGNYSITPELKKVAGESMLFENIYAASPSTNKTLFSLICSTYPLISYNAVTQEYPDIPQESLSGVLKDSGYRTSFITTADVRFQRSDEFLKYRSFDLIMDYRSMDPSTHFSINEYSEGYGIGADDEMLHNVFVDWHQEATEQPFLSILWSNQGHYPYFFNDVERDFDVADLGFNRYLNTIAHNDAVIGKLIGYLKRNGLYDKTLLVVIGDHGEAFRQHGQTGHATHIYEENVHIPMLLINPRLFSGERNKTIGSILDIAPTALALTGHPIPNSWQGESLLDADRIEKAYFTAQWSEVLHGMRSGPYKAIFKSSTESMQVFDLSVDPDERHNLSLENPDLTHRMKTEISAWIQYQRQFMKELVTP